MKKPLGCFSTYGLIASVLTLIGVGVLTLLSGGVLFSPGPLTAASRGSGPLQGYASHADMERECVLCHRPWAGADMQRCLACHTAVDEQIRRLTGLHGQLQDAESCTRCHSEHRGREAEIDAAARSAFPHQQVGFSLAYHSKLADGAPFVCADCHDAPGYGFEQSICITCHRELDAGYMEQHIAGYDSACFSCHRGDEILAGFDHQVVFALQGAHAALSCQTCHAEHSLQELSAGGVACHPEPEIHRGRFGTDCVACHTAVAWAPASLRYHDFPLDHGSSVDVACQVCHPDDYLNYTCAGCHEHEPVQTERQHREEGLQEIADCARCHPRGEVEKED
jgi:hypothetical protein